MSFLILVLSTAHWVRYWRVLCLHYINAFMVIIFLPRLICLAELVSHYHFCHRQTASLHDIAILQMFPIFLLLWHYCFLPLPVERQIAAIRAIRDVEIEHLLTELCLLRSHFNKEQLQTPVLRHFSDNHPNLSVVRKGENRQIEVQWNSKERKILTIDSGEVHVSLLHQLSMAYSNCSAAIPSMDGLEFSIKTGTSKFCFRDA